MMTEAFDHMVNQAHDVVGDGCHRKALNGRLELQLQALAPVHGGQQFLAALLLLDFDPGAKQVRSEEHTSEL